MRLDPLVHPPRELLREVADERRDVVLALAQRRIHDRKHVQAVIQVAAELSVRHHRRRDRGWSRPRAGRRRGSSACCQGARTPAPAAPAAASAAAPGGCRRPRPGTASRRAPARTGRRFCAMAPVNAPLLVPEQLALEQPGGDGGAVQLHERPAAAAAQVVDGAGDQLLAGTRLPLDEHGGVGRRDDLDLLQHLLQRRALADDLLEVVLGPDLLFEVQLLGGQLFLQLGNLPVRQRVLHRDGDLLRYLTQQLDVVR